MCGACVAYVRNSRGQDGRNARLAKNVINAPSVAQNVRREIGRRYATASAKPIVGFALKNTPARNAGKATLPVIKGDH